MAELLGVFGQHYRSFQQLKFEVVEKQQTVHKIIWAAMFLLSK